MFSFKLILALPLLSQEADLVICQDPSSVFEYANVVEGIVTLDTGVKLASELLINTIISPIKTIELITYFLLLKSLAQLKRLSV